MKNMVLLLDSNVLISYLMKRKPEYIFAEKIIDCCRQKKIYGYMAFHSISIIWYVLRKEPIAIRRGLLLDLCECVTVVGAKHEKVVDAILNESFADFEDCLQEKCAESVSADYIVTENIKDFKTSSIPAVTSAEIVGMLTK